MKIKNRLFLAATLCMLLCLSGCMSSAELKNRTIVKMVGVDAEGEEFILTMLQFAPKAESGEKTSESETKIAQVRGKSISEAIGKVSQYTGNEVFLGNSGFLVIGKEAAEQGVERALNFFNSNHEVSPELYIVMAKDKAEDVIRVQCEEGAATTQLKSLVEQGQKNGLLGSPTLRDVMNRLQSDCAEPYLPLVDIVKSKNGEKVIKISGMAVCKDGKAKELLSVEEARGVLWATDELHRALLTVDFGEEKKSTASVELGESKSRVKVHLKEGKPVLELSIKSKGHLKEVNFDRGGGVKMEELKEIENEVFSRIKSTAERTIDKVLFREKCDVFRYSEFIKKEEPDYWKKNEQRWDEVIDEMKIHVFVNCKIDHPGLEAKHHQVAEQR